MIRSNKTTKEYNQYSLNINFYSGGGEEEIEDNDEDDESFDLRDKDDDDDFDKELDELKEEVDDE